MADRDTSNRRLIALPQDLAEALLQYRAAKYIRTEASAVRTLVKLGLEILQAANNEKARSLPIEPL